MTSRRDFLKAGSLSLGALAVGPELLRAAPGAAGAAGAWPTATGYAPLPPVYTDPATRELMMEALDAAKRAGASYADVRIGRYRQNFVGTREQQIINVVDTDTIGCGVRVLVTAAGASRPRAT